MNTYSQWHYIAGYCIVLLSHNWPLLACLIGGGWHATRLLRQAAAVDVRRLYGWALLAFAYEYDKHLLGIIAEAIDFLLAWTFWQWNRPAHIVARLGTPCIVALALWMFWRGYRLAQPTPARRWLSQRWTGGPAPTGSGDRN